MEKRVLTFKEACDYCNFEESYMYRLTSERKIPHSKPLGKKLFFDRLLLENWLLSNPVATAEKINAEASTYVATHK